MEFFVYTWYAKCIYEEGSDCMLTSAERKTSQINVRVNSAEREMIEQLRNHIRPRVSASRLLVYLCEEKAREMGIIRDLPDGNWTIGE